MKARNTKTNNSRTSNSRIKNMDASREKEEKGLQELYVEQLKDIFNAENQLVKALPKMARAASSSELKAAFEEHLEITKEHVSRVEKVLSMINEKGAGKKCKAMEGLVEEGAEAIEESEEYEESIGDAGLIAAAQRVEHYEIAAYGTVRTYAEILGFEDAAQILQQTLDEEGEADKTLTALSESLIANQSA